MVPVGGGGLPRWGFCSLILNGEVKPSSVVLG